MSSNVVPNADHEPYSVSLQDSFLEDGLQVIVKISTIELDPSTPSFPGEDWYCEAQMNEHIVATAVYYFDVDNITESRLAFRQATMMDRFDFHDDPHWPEKRHQGVNADEALASVLGIDYDPNESINYQIPNTQELGSVVVQEGRFLTWPNTLQHRVEPFTLEDGSRPGHRRCIVLYLVDPHHRLPSTAVIPPQQHDWWAEAALADRNFASNSSYARLPAEARDMIAEATDKWPIGHDEALRIKDKVENDRRLAFKAILEMTQRCWPDDW